MLNRLKEKLLATGYFIDNQYLKSYVELVSTCEVSKSAFKTQTHHILPKTYFKIVGLAVDNSKSNLVELLFKDHVYAHWLLGHCACGILRKNNLYATRFLLNGAHSACNKKELSEADLNQLQTLYETSLLSIKEEEFVSYYSTHLCRETAKHFDIGLNTVTRLAIEYRCLKCKKKHTAKPRAHITKTGLFAYYIQANHSLVETAKYFNVDKSTIIRLLNDYEIFKRNNKHFQNRVLINSIDLNEFKCYYLSHTAKETMVFFKLDSMAQVKYICKKFNIQTTKSKPKKIIRYDPNTNLCIEYAGSYCAAKQLALELGSQVNIEQLSSIIRRACRGAYKTYKGFIWKYK